MTFSEKVFETGIVPVVVLNNVEDAVPLAGALLKGGIDFMEITFRTECAAECISVISKEVPDMTVGAGTVLNVEQAKLAVDCGAKFIVSPGLDEATVKWAIENDIPVIPGTVTPTEIMKAISLGLKVVKFFPAENAGGLKMIKAMSAPYTMMKFMPTGGINATNVRDYLACDKILACGGSWMVKGDLVNAGDFAQIEKLTREAADIVKEIRG